jgi:FdhD protein
MASEEVGVVRLRNGQSAGAVDRVAVEEPLEIRLQGRTFATIMRTPGADCELAAGFLFAERIVRSADDIGTIAHCRDTDTTTANTPAIAENVINVTLTSPQAAVVERALTERRQVVTNASCGVCGRLTIESLRADLPPVRQGAATSTTMVSTWPGRLRAAQPLFDETGGLHAAGLFDRHGALATSAEDVGRHNAVDKVIGRMLMREALPLADHALFVSGRTSFEIVQKAWCAGIPIVGSVSAPSSLAIALAREAGMTLIGFVRDGGFNIYAHPERVVQSA